MRVLLTGHDGYIGAVAVPLLHAAGHEVRGLDSGLFAGCDFGPPPVAPSLGSLRRDLRDVDPQDVAGFDAVIHLAALSNDPLGDLDPSLTHAINLEATLRLAELARAAGVRRFLFASSCSNYGAGGEGPLDETAPLAPLTPYAVAKVEAERALLGLADDGFIPVCLRNATVYGVSPRLRLDLVLNNLVAWATLTGRVRLMSTGSAWRPIVHVRDVVAALIAVLEAPREAVDGQVFNVCSSAENYRVRELAEIVVEAVPGSRVEIAPGAEPDRRSYRVDGSKIRELVPAFEPQWDARRGAEELATSYRRLGLHRADLDGTRYVRLNHLRSLLESGGVGADLRPVQAAEPPVTA